MDNLWITCYVRWMVGERNFTGSGKETLPKPLSREGKKEAGTPPPPTREYRGGSRGPEDRPKSTGFAPPFLPRCTGFVISLYRRCIGVVKLGSWPDFWPDFEDSC